MEMNWSEKWFVNSAWRNRLVVRILYRPFLNRIPHEPRKILEIGCGIGSTTCLIGERFSRATVMGLDFDGEQVALAQARAHPSNVMFIQGDAMGFPFEDNTFDALFSLLTFHHLENYQRSLKECLRVLRPGGRLYVIELGLWSIHRLKWLFPAPVIFSKNEFIASVQQAGFHIERSWGNNYRFFVIATK